MNVFSESASIRYLTAAVVSIIVFVASTGSSDAQVPFEEYPPEDAPFLDSAEDVGSFSSGTESADVKLVVKSSIAPRTIVGGTWIAQGPGPAYSGQVEGITNLEVSGSIHTVVAHPADANIVWLGATNGGVWKTTNALAASPTWTPLTDTEASLSIGAMELDPTDGTRQTIVVGIGRYSSFSRAGGLLDAGLLRSTDGGTTWTTISDPLLNGESASGIAARGSTLLFASGELFGVGGLFRSTDTGASWTKIDGGGGTGLPLEDVHDMVGDPNVPARFYLTSDNNGVYRSDDSGATWTNISDAAQIAVFNSGGNNNAELAVAPNGRVYVAVIISGQAQAIEYTDNPTAATPVWTAMDLPTTPTGAGKAITGATNASPIVITTSGAHGFGSGDNVEVKDVTGNTAANGIYTITFLSSTTFELRLSTGNGAYVSGGTVTRVNGLNPRDKPGGQGGIHFSILVDTTDSNTVYIGGDRQDLDSYPNFIGAFNYSGRLWRGDTTVTPTGASPSPQWEHLTHSNSIASIPGGGTASNSSPHADSREMVMDANGQIIEVDDGGIYRRTSPASNTGDWFSMNGTVQTNEQHDVAYDTNSNIIISGNQDTGTTQQQTPGSLTWDSVSTADGGDVAVDSISVAPNSIRYASFQNLNSFRRRTYNSSNALLSIQYPALTGSSGWNPSFVSPVEVNAVNGARIVIGGSNGILESLNNGDTVTYLPTSRINDDCLAYGANGVAEVLYAAAGSAVLVRLTGSGAPVATTTPFPGSTVTDLAIDPSNQSTLYAIDSNQVFVTTNAGTSWTDVTGDLVNTNLRAVEFMLGRTTSVVVGGQGGAFRMDPSDPGVWDELGSGMPNIVVFDLDYDPIDDVLVAGTLGRGAWLLQDASDTGPFAVTAGDFVSSGDAGGPFSPTCKTYNIANTDTSSLNWSVSSNAFWLDISPSSGTLAAGADIDVNVCVNALAVYAPPGDQIATVTFSDLTNTIDVVRGATLAVTNPNTFSVTFDMNSNPGWTTEGAWAFGTPTGGGTNNGDPTSGHTGSNVYGFNLSGDYTNDLAETNLTTTALDFSGVIGVTLRFWRWLGIEQSIYDNASVRVSNDGSNWTTVWQHSGGNLSESAWSEQIIDISAVADNQSNVFVRWVMGTTDFSIVFPGWNIDDVTFSGSAPTLTMGSTVWVDFAYSGTEDGSESQPYNTFEEGRQALIPGGTIKVKGDTAQRTTTETSTIQRPATLTSVNGAVSIGVP